MRLGPDLAPWIRLLSFITDGLTVEYVSPDDPSDRARIVALADGDIICRGSATYFARRESQAAHLRLFKAQMAEIVGTAQDGADLIPKLTRWIRAGATASGAYGVVDVIIAMANSTSAAAFWAAVAANPLGLGLLVGSAAAGVALPPAIRWGARRLAERALRGTVQTWMRGEAVEP